MRCSEVGLWLRFGFGVCVDRVLCCGGVEGELRCKV